MVVSSKYDQSGFEIIFTSGSLPLIDPLLKPKNLVPSMQFLETHSIYRLILLLAFCILDSYSSD